MPDTDNLYPPASFSFSLNLADHQGTAETLFQEVSGINVNMGVEEVVSGGQNSFKYRLPGVSKYSNLVLKRGLVHKDSGLFTWCYQTLNQGMAQPIQIKMITLALLDADHYPLISWVFSDAYPVKWSVSEFNSSENAYAIETVEFAYTSFKTVKK